MLARSRNLLHYLVAVCVMLPAVLAFELWRQVRARAEGERAMLQEEFVGGLEPALKSRGGPLEAAEVCAFAKDEWPTVPKGPDVAVGGSLPRSETETEGAVGMTKWVQAKALDQQPDETTGQYVARLDGIDKADFGGNILCR